MLIGTIGSNTAINVLTAGDSFDAVFQRPDHLASLWTAQFVLMRDGSKVFKIDATAEGDNFKVYITSTQSLSITPGAVKAVLLFTLISDDAVRESEYIGDLTVLPNPLDVLAPTENQQALVALNATINVIVSQPEHTASFNGQTYTLHSLADLFAIRDRLQALVDAELRAVGASTRGSFKIIRNRFR